MTVEMLHREFTCPSVFVRRHELSNQGVLIDLTRQPGRIEENGYLHVCKFEHTV